MLDYLIINSQVSQYPGRSIKTIGYSVYVGLQYHIYQNKLLALSPHRKHIGVNGIGLDVFGVKITVRIIHHCTQFLCCTPSPPCLSQVPKPIVFYDCFVPSHIHNRLSDWGNGCNVRKGQCIVMLHKQVLCHLLDADILLNTETLIFHGYIVTHMKDGCFAIAWQSVQKIGTFKGKLILRPCLCAWLELVISGIP